MFEKLAKLGRGDIGTQPCPEICWDKVVRIVAIGTDAIGSFEVSLFFYHSDGTRVRLFTEHQGYTKILDSLSERFPSIQSTWRNEMAETPWGAERVLYSQQ